MAADGGDAEDRTEAATPRRLQRAREEGHVPLSREVSSFAVLGSAALVLAMQAPDAARALAGRLAAMLEHAHDTDPQDALRAATVATIAAAAPFVLAALLAGCAAVLLQTGFLFNIGALRPDLARLSPLAGLHRLFGPATLLETGKALLKAVAAGLVLAMVLKAALPALGVAMFWYPAALAQNSTAWLTRLLVGAVAVQGAVALFDVIRTRLKHARDMRMSREDIRQEARESEGDPHVKARLRQLRQQLSRRRMMAAVPKATVVVTNPTHYAIALVYHRGGGGAPRVTAKGVDAIAARIRAVAEENKVPLVANPPLARALYRVELDAEIPAEHFQAVAEIIAYVWRLRGRAGGAAA